jgi:hypothetical protein
MKAIIVVSCVCLSFPLFAMTNSSNSSLGESNSNFHLGFTSLTNNDYKKSHVLHIFGKPGHIYLGATVNFSKLKTQNMNPSITYYNGFLNDTYPNKNNNARAANFSLQGGYEFLGDKKFRPAIAFGLGIYTTPSEYSNSGQVIETPLGDAAETLYNYKYNVNSTRLMLEGKFTWTIRHVKPFIDLGIGVASTQLRNYSETAVDATGYPPLPPFNNHTNVRFAYQAGLGLGYEFNFSQTNSEFQHEQVSLGYRYVNLGSAELDTRGSLYPYKLNLGKASTQDIYFAFNHLF